MQMVRVINLSLKNASKFRRLNQIFCFGEGIIFEIFVASQVKWHRSYFLKFNDKLQRARKRKYEQSITNKNSGQKRSHLQHQSLGNSNCSLCKG